MLVVEEMGHTAKPIRETALEDQLLQTLVEASGEALLESRPPVVTVMGPRGSRQDLAAGLHPPHTCGGGAKPAASRSTSAPIRWLRRKAG